MRLVPIAWDLNELETGTGYQIDAVIFALRWPGSYHPVWNFRESIPSVTQCDLKAAVSWNQRYYCSSETTYGIFFQMANVPFAAFRQELWCGSWDSYGLSKVVNEKTAAFFQRASGVDIYAFGSEMWLSHTIRWAVSALFQNMKTGRKHSAILEHGIWDRIVGFICENDLGFQIFNAGKRYNGAIIQAKIGGKCFPVCQFTGI